MYVTLYGADTQIKPSDRRTSSNGIRSDDSNNAARDAVRSILSSSSSTDVAGQLALGALPSVAEIGPLGRMTTPVSVATPAPKVVTIVPRMKTSGCLARPSGPTGVEKAAVVVKQISPERCS